MTYLIDKGALVAEIEKIIADETESIKSFGHSKNASEVQRSNARIGVLMHIRSLLDTLEVKEVDLNEEYDNYADVQKWMNKAEDLRWLTTTLLSKHIDDNEKIVMKAKAAQEGEKV